MKERRAAARLAVIPPLDARLSGVPVRVVELSMLGARLEHEQRFALAEPELEIACQGTPVNIPVHVVRSEVVGGSGTITYRTGIEFTGDQLLAQHVVSILLTEMGLSAEEPGEEMPSRAETEPSPPPDSIAADPVPSPAPAASPSLDDSWTRRVKFLREDTEDDLPFAQFHLQGEQWTKEYAATPEQPDDGFTVRRDSEDFAELQHAYACADDDTRRMMRIALQSKLAASEKSGR